MIIHGEPQTFNRNSIRFHVLGDVIGRALAKTTDYVMRLRIKLVAERLQEGTDFSYSLKYQTLMLWGETASKNNCTCGYHQRTRKLMNNPPSHVCVHRVARQLIQRYTEAVLGS